MFSKVLIANRGEIAVRIIRACRELGIRTVAIYSSVDAKSLHVLLADEAFPLHSSPEVAYLNVEEILDVAEKAHVDAIHPGYGFLSENPSFAEAVVKAGFTFIGPNPDALKLAGDKIAAKDLAARAGIPVVPGSFTSVDKPEEALKVAESVGYPVIIKAALGGGGIGMRVVRDREELLRVYELAREEARRSFNDSRVYVEKYLPRPRHIEVQVVADNYGNVIHLCERECSIQRRYQKLIEEAPSPVVTEDMRKEIGEYAVRFAEKAGYTNLGTVEFLYHNGSFYYIEANARLQVEHGVTEMITGVDLVKTQILIAADKPLEISQEEVRPRGWAIEARINAEDPLNDFTPSPGTILEYREPGGPGVRVDSGVYEGYTVPKLYSPLIAKLIVWGSTRAEAVCRLRRALGEFVVRGIKTTIPVYRFIAEDEDFIRGNISTEYLSEKLNHIKRRVEEEQAAIAAALAVALSEVRTLYNHCKVVNPTNGKERKDRRELSAWRLISLLKWRRWPHVRR